MRRANKITHPISIEILVWLFKHHGKEILEGRGGIVLGYGMVFPVFISGILSGKKEAFPSIFGVNPTMSAILFSRKVFFVNHHFVDANCFKVQFFRCGALFKSSIL